jgi:ligand-binding sensor domain-containing protein
MTEDDDFDIVVHVLQTHRDRLWKMTQSNMNNDMFNVMDQIRLEQIDQLDNAIKCNKVEKSVVTDLPVNL